nr:hypothetical protein [Jiella pelagia]
MAEQLVAVRRAIKLVVAPEHADGELRRVKIADFLNGQDDSGYIVGFRIILLRINRIIMIIERVIYIGNYPAGEEIITRLGVVFDVELAIVGRVFTLVSSPGTIAHCDCRFTVIFDVERIQAEIRIEQIWRQRVLGEAVRRIPSRRIILGTRFGGSQLENRVGAVLELQIFEIGKRIGSVRVAVCRVGCVEINLGLRPVVDDPDGVTDPAHVVILKLALESGGIGSPAAIHRIVAATTADAVDAGIPGDVVGVVRAEDGLDAVELVRSIGPDICRPRIEVDDS